MVGRAACFEVLLALRAGVVRTLVAIGASLKAVVLVLPLEGGK